jgi:hypothetical protein
MTTSTKWITQLRGPKQWKPEDARRVLGAWEESGESIAGFAYRHGINAQRIKWWRDRVPASTPSLAPSVTLVPVTVRPTLAPTASSPALSLMVGDVVRVDVADASRVPPLWFAAVVEALAGRTA